MDLVSLGLTTNISLSIGTLVYIVPPVARVFHSVLESALKASKAVSTHQDDGSLHEFYKGLSLDTVTLRSPSPSVSTLRTISESSGR